MIKKILCIFAIIFGCVLYSCADSAYKNELLKVSLSPLGVNDVKVTLKMAKPYSEPLRILKKNDAEFVLILPETYNSAQKPSISDVITDVTDTTIKQYSFISNSKENGYTKILIKTNGTTNLYPEAISNGSGSSRISTDVKKAVVDNSQKLTPQAVSKVTSTQKNVEKAEVKNNEKVETLKKDVLSQIAKNTIDIKKTDVVPVAQVQQLPELVEEDSTKEVLPEEDIHVDVEEPVAVNTEETKAGIMVSVKSFVKTNLSSVKTKLVAIKSSLPNNFGRNSAISILLVAICYLLVKFAKRKPVEVVEDETQDNENKYSEFFKTIIDEEKNGNNPFTLKSVYENIQMDAGVVPNSDVEKSQDEIINIDPNLSWQEKFRALKKSKKELFKEDETEKKGEISEEMLMENPIKKLKQDFKAVRKILELQRNKNADSSITDAPIEQKFNGEVEVVTFDDYQRNLTVPKVQINTTSPMKSKPPKVLSQLHFAPKKGLYLVDYKDKVNLVGFINDKVFRLNTYDNVRNSKIYARLSEKVDGKETYIVKFDNNKMLIDVDDNHMKLKLQY